MNSNSTHFEEIAAKQLEVLFVVHQQHFGLPACPQMRDGTTCLLVSQNTDKASGKRLACLLTMSMRFTVKPANRIEQHINDGVVSKKSPAACPLIKAGGRNCF